MRSGLLLVLGWGLVVLGVVLYPLPGPGLLVLVAGVQVLVRADPRVAARLAPWRDRALRATAHSVATWPRTLLGVVATLLLAATGVLWLLGPTQPAWWCLPAWTWLPGGWWSGVAQVASGLAGVALVVVARLRLGPGGVGAHGREDGTPGGSWSSLGCSGP